MEKEVSMTSVIVAAVIAAAVFYWLIRSSRKEAHHLDDLHIVSKTDESSD
jgi:preprotein translocase subunit YajC